MYIGVCVRALDCQQMIYSAGNCFIYFPFDILPATYTASAAFFTVSCYFWIFFFVCCLQFGPLRLSCMYIFMFSIFYIFFVFLFPLLFCYHHIVSQLTCAATQRSNAQLSTHSSLYCLLAALSASFSLRMHSWTYPSAIYAQSRFGKMYGLYIWYFKFMIFSIYRLLRVPLASLLPSVTYWPASHHQILLFTSLPCCIAFRIALQV